MVVTFLVRWSRFLDGSGSIAPVWNEDKEDDNDDEGRLLSLPSCFS